MHAITPQIIPTVINPAIPSVLIKNPYQKHNPAKGEELDEFINGTDEDEDDENQDSDNQDEDEDYEQTETTINQPKTKFPDDDSNVGDNPIYPESDEVIAGGGTADPHSDRSIADRGEDNPQDVEDTDDESIDDKEGSDGKKGGDDEEDNDEIVTSIGY